MKSTFVIFFTLFSSLLLAQKYKSERSVVTFFSHATIEDIAATNDKSISIFEVSSGEIAFLITISDFQFEKSLMKEHFNEKYMESDKYPKANFKGVISGFDKNANGEQPANARGTLTIHGQSKEIDVPGSLQVLNDKIVMKSAFIIELKDFKIKIPQLLWQNIAESVEVNIEFTYKIL